MRSARTPGGHTDPDLCADEIADASGEMIADLADGRRTDAEVSANADIGGGDTEKTVSNSDLQAVAAVADDDDVSNAYTAVTPAERPRQRVGRRARFTDQDHTTADGTPGAYRQPGNLKFPQRHGEFVPGSKTGGTALTAP